MAQVLVRDLDPAIVEKLKARSGPWAFAAGRTQGHSRSPGQSGNQSGSACTRCLYRTAYRFAPAN